MQLRQAYRAGELDGFRTGTAFPNFDVKSLLATFEVVVPPEEVALRFARVFAISRRVNLMEESRTLAALRDTLLPKLISGELRVGDAERVAETAL
jgi:type I restriction enzyme S subunit